jgi:signal transduction histidine kinase
MWLLVVAMQDRPAPPDPAEAPKGRVLIVDDDQEFAESIGDILGPAGYAPVIADRAETAMVALLRFLPAVALIDIRLGASSGVDLLAQLTAQRPELITVMMTAHADTQSAIAALRRGAYDYIDKSSTPDQLLAVLERCFEKFRLQEENRAADDALRIAKEAAEAASRAKSDFLAIVSHELRTPLNAIIGFSNLMIEGLHGPVGNETYVEYLRDINTSGLDLLKIINEILELSKAEAGKLDLSEEEVATAEIVAAVCRMIAPKAAAAGLTLDASLSLDLPLLFCDPLRLKQILLNLLSNAVKFTPSGGRIEVKASADPATGLAIIIRDTGIGIAPQDLPRVMQPFEQVDSSLSRAHEGTGLGLPLAKAMIELHGGELKIESVLGGGTVVTAIFPPERLVGAPTVAPAPAATTTTPPQEADGPVTRVKYA